MMTVEEYAIDLVVEGADHVATDDTNEAGKIEDDKHQEACNLALEIARAIKDNPQVVLALVGRS